jgi:sigma-B regulation protein RsbQ
MGLIERNCIRVSGAANGLPLIFSHGYGCDQSMWRFVTPAFEDRYRVVLFDHVGAGHSDLSAYDYRKYASLHGYAEDVLAICDALELPPCVFVGHSVSAIIGALAVISQPRRFAALVLVSPSPCYLNDGDYRGGFERADLAEMLDALDANYLGWATHMAPIIMGNAERPQLADELSNSFCRTDPQIARHFAQVTFLSDHRTDLSKVPTPALILQCKVDVIAQPEVGRFCQRQLPSSELVMLNATGHCPNLSAPAETADAIAAFLERGRRG